MKLLAFFRERPVLLILIFASIFRFWGVWHDYPYSYYPDEKHFIRRSLSFGSGDFNPHWFHKPAFLMYLLFFEYGIFYVFGKIAGLFPDVNAFAAYYFKNAGPFILIGRITVTLFGIATVYVTYRLGERFWFRKAGIYASLLLALCYGHIFSGQDVKADVPTTFFTVMSMYYLLRVCSEGFKGRDYFLAGLFAGLGTATKYYSIALLPCIFLAAVFEVFRDKKIRALYKYAVSVLAFWGIYFIASPYNFLDPLGRRSTFRKIVQLWNTVSPWKFDALYLPGEKAAKLIGKNGAGSPIGESALNYMDVLFSVEGAGVVIGAVFMVAIILFLKKISIKRTVLASFPILFSIISITMNPSYTEPRHQLIIYPFLALVSGVVIHELSGKVNNNTFVHIVLGILLMFPLFSVLKNNVSMSIPDSRTVAKNWIEANIPPGTKILVEESSVYISPDEQYYKHMIELAEEYEKDQFARHADKLYKYSLMALPDITYDIEYMRFPWWQKKEIREGVHYVTSEYDKDMGNPLKPVGIEDYQYYIENRFEYVIVSSNKYEKFLGDSNTSDNFPSFAEFYKDLFSNALLVKEFTPDRQGGRGPTIKVFRLVR